MDEITAEQKRMQLRSLMEKAGDFSELTRGHIVSIGFAIDNSSRMRASPALRAALAAEHSALIDSLVSLRHELGQYMSNHIKMKNRNEKK